ncbi:MAG TPA: TIGR01777 family oxidoreductase [Pseudobdellovibrionaceae bacterium]|jgi:hypothetical protein
MKVVLTGATGLVGKELGKALVSQGHEIFVISRNATKARLQLPYPCKIIEGDLAAGPILDERFLHPMDVVINLAGESIGGGRWNEARKRRIYESRILGTRHLIKSLSVAPKIFLNASAVGYYGSHGDQDISEESAASDDFLSHVCQDWEEELLILSYGEALSTTRVVALRTGMILAAKGGALEKLLPLFRRGLGGVLGDGKQWMSWIHIDDVVGLILHILDKNSIRGPVNLVSPHPVINEEFTKILASVLGVGVGPHVPAFALWTALGEMANLLLLSQKVIPRVALQSDYKFLYPELKAALEQILESGEKDFFVTEQYLPWKPEEIFPFFSQARNLARITPPSLGFKVLSTPPEKIQLGSEITYRMKVRGFPIKWKTVITEWTPPYRFTDTQEQGPYHFWEHSHELRPFAHGTLMTDRIYYSLPMGMLGNLIGGLLARAEVEKVFEFRKETLIKSLQEELGLADSALSKSEAFSI